MIWRKEKICWTLWKKIIKSVKRFSRQTKLMFLSLIFKKIKRALTKKHIWVHLQDHLGIKNFRLGKRGNSVFAQNLLRFLRSKYWENVNFKCFTESYDEHKSKNLSERSTDSYEENVKDIRKKNLRNIVIGQHNINSLRNKFVLLTEQIRGIIDVLVNSETKLDESIPVGQLQIPRSWSPRQRNYDFCQRG